MEHAEGVFVEGLGAAAATSGVLNQLQGRIFGLLYLEPGPLSLDDIARELQQSKSNVSIHIRGLVDWHLVRRVQVEGSRKDHYEAATDFYRVMLEIMERRFRWNLRQVIAAADELERALEDEPRPPKTQHFLEERLNAIRNFFQAVDTGAGAFIQGKAFSPDAVREALRWVGSRGKRQRGSRTT